MPTSLDVVKDRLRTFADSAVGESPLYTHLASCAAEDAAAGIVPECAAASAPVRRGSRGPNRLVTGAGR